MKYNYCVVESNLTKDRYFVVNDNYNIKENNFNAVIYQDYKLLNNGKYTLLENKKFHIMERNDFIKNFDLCLDL